MTTDHYLPWSDYSATGMEKPTGPWLGFATVNDQRRTFIVLPENPGIAQSSVSDADLYSRWMEARFRSYNPFYESQGALFRVFADTPLTPEGVLGFANRYGLLYFGAPIERVPTYMIALESPDEDGALRGEYIGDWYLEIKMMRRLCFLWDLVKQQQREEIASHFRVRRVGDKTKTVALLDESPDGTDLHPSDPSDRPLPIDLAEVEAATYISDNVNMRLRGSLEAKLNRDSGHQGLRLYYLPSCLHGALWLQFAIAIDAGREYGRCAECDSWFEISPDVSRSSRVYCSTACRSRAYRGRQARARQLVAEGAPVADVAKSLGTDVGTIRRWVERGGRQK